MGLQIFNVDRKLGKVPLGKLWGNRAPATAEPTFGQTLEDRKATQIHRREPFDVLRNERSWGSQLCPNLGAPERQPFVIVSQEDPVLFAVGGPNFTKLCVCLLYTSDAADE